MELLNPTHHAYLSFILRPPSHHPLLTNALQLFGPPTSGHETGKLAQHGFARTSRWEYLGKSSSESAALPGTGGDDSVKLDFGLSHGSLDSSAQQAWPHKFELTYSITLSRGALGTSLAVRNTESTPWEFQVLFHTYLKIDVRPRPMNRPTPRSYVLKTCFTDR